VSRCDRDNGTHAVAPKAAAVHNAGLGDIHRVDLRALPT